MRLYIASTSEDLMAHRAAALQVAAELGFETVTAAPEPGAGRAAVALLARRIAGAHGVLAIVGWRRGEVPGPELGGDGRRSWTEWEVRSAFRQAKPVVVLTADESWPRELREDDSHVRAQVADFRGELDRLAVPFAPEPESLAAFCDLLEHQLHRWPEDAAPPAPGRSPGLRRWPPPELPERPYPLLLPYTHPDLLGGRRRELEDLRRLLAEPVPILGLYAPSGAGKSSLLGGGLVPWLRAAGQPAAFERHADEPGLAGRLLGDLLAPAEACQIADADRHAFVERLLQAARLAGQPPVLVLDQLEDLLRPGGRTPGKERARAVVGTLLAASVQRQPGYHALPCRWVLAYRQEFHGEVCGWLADVLGEVSGTDLADASGLPHDLSGPERFHAWTLPTLGTPSAGSEDRAGEAAEAFRQAIEMPLALRHQDGELCYRWRFAADGASRLARAFAAARLSRPAAPLVPELQVVLAHLLAAAGEPEGDEVVAIEVPAEPGELIDRALEELLRRALDAAFPASLGAGARTLRTRALLALRELADEEGRRQRQGLPAAALAPAISPVGRTPAGRQVLENLAKPQTRLVVMEECSGEWRYVLSHDRMAEVIVRWTDGEGGGSAVDAKLLDLRRFVALESGLFEAGEVEQATQVPAKYCQRIEKHAGALLLDDERRRWWAAVRRRRRDDRWRGGVRWGVAAVVLGLVILGAWSWADRWAQRQALLEQVATGEPETALAALVALETAVDAEELLERLRQRTNPFDVLERGLGGVGEEQRAAAVLRVVEIALPLFAETPEDPVLIASAVWALDFFAVRRSHGGIGPIVLLRARVLRERVLEELRRRRPPPSTPDPHDPGWADIPAGTFQMGRGPGEGPAMTSEWPRHPVTVSAFRMMTHEVTNAQYRRLDPHHEGEAELPATGLTWYEGYTYAAWLGGRLPTEAEWEYAARAGCAYAYCKRDGSEASLDEVAWWVGNATDALTSNISTKPVRQLEPNPWGLFDVYGNVEEMNANWFGVYPGHPEMDPAGPTKNDQGLRTYRGGDAWQMRKSVVASGRSGVQPDVQLYDMSPNRGLRIVLPST